ncbi:hypothetical protein NY11_04515 [Listeria monocytogenes]|nr:hypothetical protein [Listeria monocytogenes]
MKVTVYEGPAEEIKKILPTIVSSQEQNIITVKTYYNPTKEEIERLQERKQYLSRLKTRGLF